MGHSVISWGEGSSLALVGNPRDGFLIKILVWGNVLPEMGAEEQAGSLDEKEVAIIMEIAEVKERGRKVKSPTLRNVLKKKLLAETAKVDKVLSKFETHYYKE